jgi:arsenate reductase
MALTIYHNPRCSKSRKTLEIIEESGISPTIIRYLDEPPSADRILLLASLIGVRVRDLVRTGESEWQEATDLPDLDDDRALAGWIARNPRVLQRPIVIDDENDKAIVGRPPENVTRLLP